VDDMNTSNISTGRNTSISSTQDNQNLLTILTMNCRSLRSEAKRNELNTIVAFGMAWPNLVVKTKSSGKIIYYTRRHFEHRNLRKILRSV
jgi:hypothetical protein